MNAKQEMQNQIYEQAKIIYSLNEKERTACIIDNVKAKGKIIISSTIKNESKEYTVISISAGAFQSSPIKSIQFPHDSKIREIEKDSFYASSIESFTIPSSLIELRSGWCNRTKKLTTLIISPRNPRYTLYENQTIIGKSSIEETNYDEIIFAARNIKQLSIPKFIRNIESFSFYECRQLHQIEIPFDSELQTIKNYAFLNSAIENFSIPFHLSKIGKYAFSYCKKLRQITIHSSSKLKEIDDYAFYESSIENFYFPSHLTRIGSHSFYSCNRLCYFEIDADSKLQQIEECAFCGSSIECFSIPHHISQIKKNIFRKCKKLQIIEFDENSKIESIDKSFLVDCRKVIIMIPVNSSIPIIFGK